MTLSITLPRNLSKWTDLVGNEGRHNLYSVAANAVQILVRSHLSREAMKRHFSAFRLNATPTGILSSAARRTTFHATSDYGMVVIPSPAVLRALGPVSITAKRAQALTIPVNRFSYGHRVSELAAHGWTIFRPKGKDVLMGSNGKDEEPVALYVLKKRVEQKQDRSLLPSDSDIGTAAARAMVVEIKRVAQEAAA